MSHIVLIITFIISLFGLIFKTTVEDKENGRKRLSNYGWGVLTLMLIGLLLNILININKSNESKEKERAAREKNTNDSLIRELEHQRDSIRWHEQGKEMRHILESSKENIRSLESQNKLLEQNNSLHMQLSTETKKNNVFLRERLAASQRELINLKNPIDSLSLNLKVRFAINQETHNNLLSVIRSENKIGDYTNISKLLQEKMPEVINSIRSILVSFTFYPSSNIETTNANFYSTVYTFNFVLLDTNFWNNEKGVEVYYRENKKELVFQLKEISPVDVRIGVTISEQKAINVESFNDLCNQYCLIDIERVDKNSSLNFESSQLFDIELRPTRKSVTFRGFFFTPSEEHLYKKKVSSFKAWIFKDFACYFD
ncbi:hypothetical protein [Parasegetibacter sp. NRK P23]|uniref:hypothetical protein n=1 Tax=Parasegetibacter sp. NRK P23 TaxID=2942999 RepID=UPI002043B69E|nr:hypothetical protein [Parasegetibacter sp. NRK P23]MCM5530626.1 hypothetical protein [Parasegetibacter sp. NRK P23]